MLRHVQIRYAYFNRQIWMTLHNAFIYIARYALMSEVCWPGQSICQVGAFVGSFVYSLFAIHVR